MRRVLVICVALSLVGAAMAESSWAMGLFKKRGRGSNSGTDTTGVNFTTTSHHGGSSSGTESFSGLDTSVLPDGDPTDSESLLREIHNPVFNPPQDGWKDAGTDPEDFEHPVLHGSTPGNQPYAVPEPMTVSLFGMGLAGLLLKRRAR